MFVDIKGKIHLENIVRQFCFTTTEPTHTSLYLTVQDIHYTIIIIIDFTDTELD